MADIILINPHGTKYVGDFTLPLGLLQSAVYINETYDVKLLDLRVKPNWKFALLSELKKNPHFVGISTITGPNLTSALEISKFVKENSTALVIWGGIHATLLPEDTIKHPLVDIVVKGEGEETFNELANAIIHKKPLKNILGIWYKENGKIKSNQERPPVDLNKLPQIPFDILEDIEKYVWTRPDGIRVMSYMSSRGCPQQCSFCYITDVYKSRWKPYEAERVLDDFQYMIDRFKLGHIYINDDNFFVNPKRSLAIAQGIIDRKLDISWDVLGAHAGSVVRMSKEDINLYDQSRCTGLLIGAESGSQRLHDEIINKKITPLMVIESNKKFIGTGIIPTYTFMSGFPTETKEDLKMTIELLFKLWDDNKNIIPGNIKPFIPYPGTPLYRLALEHGFKPPNTIEGWAETTWDNYVDVDIPWFTKKEKLLRANLYYSTVLMNQHYQFTQNKAFNIVTKVIGPWMRYRTKSLNFAFPLDISAARALHHVVN